MSSLAIMGISYIVEKNIKESIIIDVNEAFNNSFKNWGKAIVTSLLASLIVLAGLFIFIFPGLFMAINYVFVFNVVALRKKTGIEALRYSRLLLNGRWIKGFGYVVIIGLLNFGLAMIISLITSLIPYNIIIGVIGDTITCCILSFVSVCLSVIFLNLDYTAKTSIS